MTIQIEDLKFQCIIGILDFERLTPQDVVINITIKYNYTNKFINYVDISDLVKTTMKNEKFLLIEDALKSLNEKLKKKFPLINTLDLKITKPSILPDCRVSVANSYTFDS
ncbi:dihydroneopterin aldolase [Sulfurimonas sp.]